MSRRDRRSVHDARVHHPDTSGRRPAVTAVVLAVAWSGLVVAVACRLRPPPSRTRLLATRSGPAGGAGPEHRAAATGSRYSSTGGAGRSRPVDRSADGAHGHADPSDPRAGVAAGRRVGGRPDVLAVAGGGLLRVARRIAGRPAGGADDPGRARAAGAAALAVGVAALVALPLAPVAAFAAWALPRHRARAAERARLRRLEAALPETVDLLVLAVGAGCNVPLAVAAAGRRGSGPLAGELRRIAGEVACGRRLAEALDELASVAGEPARPLAGVLAACERYGTPVLPALQRLSDEVRVQRQRRAEAAARRVPVTLLFPLVLCILPAFALLTVAPLVAGALRELRL